MTTATDAVTSRMRRISNTLHLDDLGESWADVDAYIDALFDFEHISEDDWSRLHRESRALRNETAAKLRKKASFKRY
ncbi:hypothetical protein [Pseudomonas sp. MPC6]|uniref:hypothetical protein n=1 Tax=unclassified Pseudomonas TaxID=196821 RepID=UPI0011109C15|nr:hypothetical protein [Pseudomonas sp. MPC6]QCY09584.1 hypothetical protein ELQ88_01810 [Pseudomonas sp. MPC6]